MTFRFWHGLLRVTHPDAWIQGAFYMLLGTYLGGGVISLLSPTVIHAMVVVALIIAASFAFNDFHDVEADKKNRPNRAVPSGQVSPIAALFLAILLVVSAFVLAWFLSPKLLIIAIINIILSASYTLFLKKMPIISHLTIAYLNTTIILFGCMVVTAPTLVIWLVSIAGFFFTLAQETILVVEDHSGDKQTGINTTAVFLGPGKTLFLFRTFAILSIVTMLMPWLLRLTSSLYLYALLPCSILPIIKAVSLVTPKVTDQNIRSSSKLVLWSRALSLLPVLLLGFSK